VILALTTAENFPEARPTLLNIATFVPLGILGRFCIIFTICIELGAFTLNWLPLPTEYVIRVLVLLLAFVPLFQFLDHARFCSSLLFANVRVGGGVSAYQDHVEAHQVAVKAQNDHAQAQGHPINHQKVSSVNGANFCFLFGDPSFAPI